MDDLETLRQRIGEMNYRAFDLEALAPLKRSEPIAPSSPEPPASTPPVRQAFGPISAPLVTTPSPALAFTQYAARPTDSRLDGSVLLTDLFKRLEDHAR